MDNKKINTVGELRTALAHLNDSDVIAISESITDDNGNIIDWDDFMSIDVSDQHEHDGITFVVLRMSH